MTRGAGGTGDSAARMTRLPAGYPEDYHAGFANIHAEAAKAIIAHRNGVALIRPCFFPSLRTGLKGVAFADACVRSSAGNAASGSG
jgi:hypothetical protein